MDMEKVKQSCNNTTHPTKRTCDPEVVAAQASDRADYVEDRVGNIAENVESLVE